MKISFELFRQIMSRDLVAGRKCRKIYYCTEIQFAIDNCEEYREAWMGKMVDKKTGNDVYWYGLTPDGLQAYDFGTFEEFIAARVFHGKSLQEIWELISLYSLDGGSAEEALLSYMNDRLN